MSEIAVSQIHRYAEDAVQYVTNPENWSDVLNCFTKPQPVRSMGLQTNWLKTKIQNIGAIYIPDPKPVVMDNQSVESVMKFMYLRSDVGVTLHLKFIGVWVWLNPSWAT